ncbi:MAG: Uma2 family endonuclease [bacterium]|nr:Uma2 family endonuclease [bacterium]
MSPEPQRKWTAEEYLAFERESPIKHEHYGGEISAMAGASAAHNRITWNIVEALGPQLKARGCEGFVADMRVLIPATGLYTYPDVAVVCDEPEFADEELDTLLNPILIIEILSPATEDYDRGRKFAHYRSLPSLSAYLVIAQEEVRAELSVRQPDGSWRFSETTAIDARVELSPIGATLTLADVYARVRELRGSGHGDEHRK